MSKVRARGEEVRRFILESVEKQVDNPVRVVADKFGISRQAVNKHLQRLAEEGALTESGKTRAKTYKLAPISEWDQTYIISAGLEEHAVWTKDIAPHLGQLPENILNIWQIGFTEMFNNAMEHSEGSIIAVHLTKTAVDCEMLIADNGVGIFNKIQRQMNLDDPRHAILELSKGKLTTDPKHHSGLGIFFTSRMFDSFDITSYGVVYSHEFGNPEDWILEPPSTAKGTGVFLKIHNHTARTARKVYDAYSSAETPGFEKTVVPVKLARYGNDQLVSRSQAKRVLSRIDLFKVVLFDFSDVPEVGQAFADEIFRVFALAHPDMELIPMHANKAVMDMVDRARVLKIMEKSDGDK